MRPVEFFHHPGLNPGLQQFHQSSCLQKFKVMSHPGRVFADCLPQHGQRGRSRHQLPQNGQPARVRQEFKLIETLKRLDGQHAVKYFLNGYEFNIGNAVSQQNTEFSAVILTAENSVR